MEKRYRNVRNKKHKNLYAILSDVIHLTIHGIDIIRNAPKGVKLVGSIAGIIGLSSTLNYSTPIRRETTYLDNAGVVLDGDYGYVDPYQCNFYYLQLNGGNLTEKDVERLNYYNNVGIITSIGPNVYETIDNVKDIVERFNITGAILCDIRDIASEDDYRNVKIFCDKLNANGCYVGFYGDDNMISSIKEKAHIADDIDYFKRSIAITDSEDKLKHSYMGYEKDNEIRESIDTNQLISSGNYNTSSLFVEDGFYVVESGDTLEDISKKYNMDLEDFIHYNGLTDSSLIYPGDVLLIPSDYKKKDTEDGKIYEDETDAFTASGIGYNENIKRIIDVSEHNEHLNWDMIASLYEEGKLDGVILRMTESYNPDTKTREFYLDKEFEYNLSECNRLGIPYGVYCFSRGINEEEIMSEINDISNYIDFNLNQNRDGMDLSFHPSLPVYIDAFEDDAITQERLLIADSGCYDVELAANLVNMWCREMTERYGFYTGLYSNKNLVRQAGLNDYLDRDYVQELWLANYGYQDSRLQLGEHTLSNSPEWELSQNACSMYQISEQAYLFDPNEKYVDMNLCDPELFTRSNNYYHNKTY